MALELFSRRAGEPAVLVTALWALFAMQAVHPGQARAAIRHSSTKRRILFRQGLGDDGYILRVSYLPSLNGQVYVATKENTGNTDNPTVVVVDTNAFHEGRLTRSGIKSLQSLTNLGLHVIVPDVVCRELASHAWHDFKPAQELLLLSDIDISTLDVPEDIYKAFVIKVEATGATVAESKNHHIQRGLHAQILRTAPASPKGTVTTGAVDYIVHMHALEARDRYSTVAVVTNDKVLRKSLGEPGIQLFGAFGEVRKGDVSHMRLPLLEALAPIKYLLTEKFENALAGQIDSEGRARIKVVGVNDVLRLNDKELGAYVDVSVPTFIGVDSDSYGRDIDRYLVTLDEETFSLLDNRLIGSEPFAIWPPELTHINEYLSTELSMVPSVIRPVPENGFISASKTPLTFSENNSHIIFAMHSEEIAVVEYSSYIVTQEHQHDGDIYIDKTQATDIFLSDPESQSKSLAKGELALLLINKAIELLK